MSMASVVAQMTNLGGEVVTVSRTASGGTAQHTITVLRFIIPKPATEQASAGTLTVKDMPRVLTPPGTDLINGDRLKRDGDPRPMWTVTRTGVDEIVRSADGSAVHLYTTYGLEGT